MQSIADSFLMTASTVSRSCSPPKKYRNQQLTAYGFRRSGVSNRCELAANAHWIRSRHLLRLKNRNFNSLSNSLSLEEPGRNRRVSQDPFLNRRATINEWPEAARDSTPTRSIAGNGLPREGAAMELSLFGTS